MEALITAIITALVTISLKPAEKISENLGDVIWTKAGELVTKLREKKKAPSLTTALDENQPQRLDYGQAVLELQAAVEDPEIKEAVLEVEAAAKKDPEIAPKVKEILSSLAADKTTMPNLQKLADKIGQVVIGGTANIENMNF
jgi:uncharacterized membrane-anchored protein YjiN (DUF445 family)